MSPRIKNIFILALTLLVGAVASLTFIRKVPSISHQGHYTEKYLWSKAPSVFGGKVTHFERFEVFDRYEVFNSTDHSIWISAYDRGHGWQPITEIRLASVPPPGTDPPYPGQPPRDQWHSWSLGCGSGVRARDIEIPAGSSWTFLLGARTRPEQEDLKGVRIPFRTSKTPERRTPPTTFMDSMLRKLHPTSITVPLRPILEKDPAVVDRLIDERFTGPETSENAAPAPE
jgi:hypothetical protein